jgi:inner membrane protein
VPTVFTHPAVPLAIGLGLSTRVVPPPLLFAGIAASILPDLDVVAFRFGIAYSEAAGHRGFSHSIAFAALLGLLALACSRRLGASRVVCFWFVFVAAVSHGLLDMFTNGGLGVALFWPTSSERFFFPVHPIEVSPLSLRRVLSESGVRVFESEALWVWLPSLLLGTGLRFARRRVNVL